MQRVDPFMPIASHRKTSMSPNKSSQPIAHQTGTVEGFMPQKPERSHFQTVAKTKSPKASHQVAKGVRSRPRNRLHTVAIVAAVLVAGLAVQVLVAGEILIAVYALYALVYRTTSRTTFMLVLLSLATVVVLHVSGRGEMLASNFAVYGFLLMCVGVVSLVREVRQIKK